MIPRIINTAQLGVLSMLFAMVVSLLLGCISAMYWNRPLDKLVTVVSLLGICTPVFVTGLVGIYLFSIYLGWLPISGMSSWRHFVLPVITLGAQGPRSPAWCAPAWSTRSARTTSSRRAPRASPNVPGRASTMRSGTHSCRSSRCSGWASAHTLGGSVVTETIFNWPGLGRLMVNSILTRDLPITQGAIFFFAMIFILVNLVVDLLYTWFDPRISYD